MSENKFDEYFEVMDGELCLVAVNADYFVGKVTEETSMSKSLAIIFELYENLDANDHLLGNGHSKYLELLKNFPVWLSSIEMSEADNQIVVPGEYAAIRESLADFYDNELSFDYFVNTYNHDNDFSFDFEYWIIIDQYNAQFIVFVEGINLGVRQLKDEGVLLTNQGEFYTDNEQCENQYIWITEHEDKRPLMADTISRIEECLALKKQSLTQDTLSGYEDVAHVAFPVGNEDVNQALLDAFNNFDGFLDDDFKIPSFVIMVDDKPTFNFTSDYLTLDLSNVKFWNQTTKDYSFSVYFYTDI